MYDSEIKSGGTSTSPVVPSEMAQRLKAHMEEAGLSYAQAAIQTWISKGTLGPWLSGTYNGVTDRACKRDAGSHHC